MPQKLLNSETGGKITTVSLKTHLYTSLGPYCLVSMVGVYRTPTPLLLRAQSNLLAGAHSGPGTCCELVCTCSLLHHVPISSSLVVALAFTGRAGRVAPWLLCSSVVSCALLWYSYINPSAGINMFTSADSCVPACHLIWY